jgi:hypothetical protein
MNPLWPRVRMFSPLIVGSLIVGLLRTTIWA